MRKVEGGVVIEIEVKLKSKGDLVEWAEDKLTLSVNSAAVENKANKEVVERMSKIFKRGKNQIKIIGGNKSKTKSVLIEGIEEEEVKEILRRY